MRPPVTRIAMWSGPRNISTAMMRAFENRADTVVWDEPYYAAELAASGRDHPMRDVVIAAGPTAPDAVVARLLGPLEDPAKPAACVFYQKHMTHHMLPQFDQSWVTRPDVVNAFLIRAPERVLASYARTWGTISLETIGVPQLHAIFERTADRLGRAPPIIDADDVLAAPEATLRALCSGCSIAFDRNMLAWPAGRRASDGVWAPAWYHSVERSTGFGPADRSPLPPLSAELRKIAEAARIVYERLRKYRLAPSQEPMPEPSAGSLRGS